MKLTRQGVRDLGGNQRKGPHKKHIHAFGPIVVVGYRDVLGYNIGGGEPIYGRKCIWCRHVKVLAS